MKVLVVDDEIYMRSLIEYNLIKKGIEVVSATNALEALEKVEKESFDLILTDIDMPEMNGYEFCKKLKDNITTKEIPIIIISCKSQEADIKKGFDCGVRDYVIKPFDPKILIRKIGEIIVNG